MCTKKWIIVAKRILGGKGEGEEKPFEAKNDLAQGLENQNTEGKTSLIFDKGLKEILKKTITIDSKKLLYLCKKNNC